MKKDYAFDELLEISRKLERIEREIQSQDAGCAVYALLALILFFQIALMHHFDVPNPFVKQDVSEEQED